MSNKYHYVYRQRNDNTFEVGFLKIGSEIRRRPNRSGWCDKRICETWNEEYARKICEGLHKRETRI